GQLEGQAEGEQKLKDQVDVVGQCEMRGEERIGAEGDYANSPAAKHLQAVLGGVEPDLRFRRMRRIAGKRLHETRLRGVGKICRGKMSQRRQRNSDGESDEK